MTDFITRTDNPSLFKVKFISIYYTSPAETVSKLVNQYAKVIVPFDNIICLITETKKSYQFLYKEKIFWIDKSNTVIEENKK